MKKLMTGMMALAITAGCGVDSTRSRAQLEELPPPIVETKGNALQADLRLRPVEIGDFSNVFVTVADIEVRANGQLLPVTVTGAALDLATPDHAWKVGTVEIPEGVEKVQVKLLLDQYGAFQGAKGAGELRANRVPIAYEASVAQMVKNKAVVEFDVKRSLVQLDDTRAVLVPKYRVQF